MNEKSPPAETAVQAGSRSHRSAVSKGTRLFALTGVVDPRTRGRREVKGEARMPRWAGAAMQEAAKGFRRLKAYKQLPLLQTALAARKARASSSNAHLAQTTKVA